MFRILFALLTVFSTVSNAEPIRHHIMIGTSGLLLQYMGYFGLLYGKGINDEWEVVYSVDQGGMGSLPAESPKEDATGTANTLSLAYYLKQFSGWETVYIKAGPSYHRFRYSRDSTHWNVNSTGIEVGVGLKVFQNHLSIEVNPATVYFPINKSIDGTPAFDTNMEWRMLTFRVGYAF